MIVHLPQGIDDPYKRLPTERYPRDPEAGEEVRIGFQTTASDAWVVLEAQEQQVRVSAQRLLKDYWIAALGALEEGAYRYWIHGAGEEAVGPFEFEVGRWRVVEKVEGVSCDETGVAVALATDNLEARATLHLSFTHPGVCRAAFAVREAPPHGNLPYKVVQGEGFLEIEAEGVVVALNMRTLELTARRPGTERPAFRGSARVRWLESNGHLTRFQVPFEAGSEEAFYGLGERFSGPNLKGQRWDVRVYEEYKEQGQRSYLPVPFLVSSRAYGLWLDAAEPSDFDLSGDTCTITLEKLPAESATFALNILVAEQPYGVTASFTRLTGGIKVPPRWAFGPWMSANTWNTQAKAEAAVQRTVAEDVPATVLVLEAWSDESTFYIFNDASYTSSEGGDSLSLKNFSFGGRWPDPKALVDACHAQGIRVLLWQIPVQKKLEEPHAQHEADEAHMLKQGYAIRNEDGSPYRCQGWWFTDGLVLDFTNPAARDWWFAKSESPDNLGVNLR